MSFMTNFRRMFFHQYVKNEKHLTVLQAMHSFGSGVVASWSVIKGFLNLEATELTASSTVFPVYFGVVTFLFPAKQE